MSKIQANKAGSKAIQELQARFPKTQLPTEINETSKHCYNILACRVELTGGTNFKLDYRIITTTQSDYNKQVAQGVFNASSYLADEIHILHDPIQYEKDMKEAEKAAKKAKEPKE